MNEYSTQARPLQPAMDTDRFKYGGDAPAIPDSDMPKRLHLCHDTVTLDAEGSFEVFPNAAAYTHRLEKNTDPLPEDAEQAEKEQAVAEEEHARAVERGLRSQDPLDFVRAGAKATQDTLEAMMEGVSELLAIKDALIASKALPVTVMLPMTLSCSKLLRTRASHQHAIEDLLAQVRSHPIMKAAAAYRLPLPSHPSHHKWTSRPQSLSTHALGHL